METFRTFPRKVLLGREVGASLLAVLIGALVGMLVVVLAVELTSQMRAIGKFVANQDVILELESLVAQHAASPTALALSKARSRALKACMNQDSRPCPKGSHRYVLRISERFNVTGRYTAAGVPCRGGATDCPLEIQTEFIGDCPEKTCDQARAIITVYRILRDGEVLRSGRAVQRLTRQATSDTNATCAPDARGRPTFANKLENGSINCVELPEPKVDLTGVKPGECPRGQVLVGVAPSQDLLCTEAITK